MLGLCRQEGQDIPAGAIEPRSSTSLVEQRETKVAAVEELVQPDKRQESPRASAALLRISGGAVWSELWSDARGCAVHNLSNPAGHEGSCVKCHIVQMLVLKVL